MEKSDNVEFSWRWADKDLRVALVFSKDSDEFIGPMRYIEDVENTLLYLIGTGYISEIESMFARKVLGNIDIADKLMASRLSNVSKLLNKYNNMSSVSTELLNEAIIEPITTMALQLGKCKGSA